MVANWHVDFFRGVALEMWRRAITPEQTRLEADFLIEALRAPESSHLLDVPCGLGRHSLELARQGRRVTGVDLSEEAIAAARALTGPLPATWIVSDMRRLPWSAEFDGAFCFGNSFCYLDPEAASDFLAKIAATLKPGARFAVETGMAAESILPALQRSRWFRLGDLIMLSENQYDPRESRLDIQYTFIQNGQVESRPASSFVLTVNEICRLHQEAGLEPLHLYGSVQKEPFQLGSPRLILISEKRP